MNDDLRLSSMNAEVYGLFLILMFF